MLAVNVAAAAAAAVVVAAAAAAASLAPLPSPSPPPGESPGDPACTVVTSSSTTGVACDNDDALRFFDDPGAMAFGL